MSKPRLVVRLIHMYNEFCTRHRPKLDMPTWQKLARCWNTIAREADQGVKRGHQFVPFDMTLISTIGLTALVRRHAPDLVDLVASWDDSQCLAAYDYAVHTVGTGPERDADGHRTDITPEEREFAASWGFPEATPAQIRAKMSGNIIPPANPRKPRKKPPKKSLGELFGSPDAKPLPEDADPHAREDVTQEELAWAFSNEMERESAATIRLGYARQQESKDA